MTETTEILYEVIPRGSNMRDQETPSGRRPIIFNHMGMLLGMHLKDYFVHQVAECRWCITITLICTFLLLSYGCRKVSNRISNY